MIEASKLRAGMTFVTNDGKLIKVLEASHHKPGKGNTIMRMKLRDVRSGSTFDTSYRPEEKFEQAIIETVPAQYLYQMDDTAYFMVPGKCTFNMLIFAGGSFLNNAC